jgi:hypothetical protein
MGAIRNPSSGSDSIREKYYVVFASHFRGWQVYVGTPLCTVACTEYSAPPLSHSTSTHALSPPQSTYIGRDETGSVYLPTQLERALQLYW